MNDNIFNRFVTGAMFVFLAMVVIGVIAYVIGEYMDADKNDKKSFRIAAYAFISFIVASLIVGYLIPGNWL